MVTLITVLSMIVMLLFIVILDAFLYQVSFMTALSLVFDIHLSIGGNYLVAAISLSILSAIVIDFRRHRTKAS